MRILTQPKAHVRDTKQTRSAKRSIMFSVVGRRPARTADYHNKRRRESVTPLPFLSDTSRDFTKITSRRKNHQRVCLFLREHSINYVFSCCVMLLIIISFILSQTEYYPFFQQLFLRDDQHVNGCARIHLTNILHKSNANR